MASHPTAGDLEIITRIALFRGLKPETVEHIAKPATAVTLKARSPLFRQGDPATAFFIMIDGWTKHYRLNKSGEEAVIHVFTKGESFAEAAALTGARFPATAEAAAPKIFVFIMMPSPRCVTDARVIRVPADHIIRLHPGRSEYRSGYDRLHVTAPVSADAAGGAAQGAEWRATALPGSWHRSHRSDHGPCVIALPYDKLLIAARLRLRTHHRYPAPSPS